MIDGAAAPRTESAKVGSVDWVLRLLVLGGVAATLWLVGQPVYANDTWIHLALGRAFADAGPWLAADPHLFAAPGPPAPSSWLGSLAIFAVQDALGFTGLRVFHVILTAMLCGGIWRLARRLTTSRGGASVVLVGFILLSTYRFVQLRPHLFTMLAMVAIALVVLVPRAGPTRAGVIFAGALAAVWANAHAAFLLGPVLVLGSSVSLFALTLVPGFRREPGERSRAGRLALAGLVMLVASLANPQGVDAHLAFLTSGGDTLALGAVADEWGPTNLLAWPVSLIPPTWAAWLLCWVSLIGVGIGGCAMLLDRLGRPSFSWASRIDPILLALATAGTLGAISANRFLWLCFFGIALAAVIIEELGPGLLGRIPRLSRIGSVLAAVLVVLMGGIHVRAGNWPLVSRALRSGAVRYDEPYHAGKYFAHSVWFLADTGLQGRVYNDYPLGGFMSFWLSPHLQMASSGTMNIEAAAMKRNFAIGARESGHEGLGFGALLDRQGIDVFLATGLPVEPGPRSAVPSTLRHLEGEPGWMLAFRSLRSAVYIRSGEPGRANAERVAAYYAEVGVLFDLDRGLNLGQTIERNPGWAIEHGLLPEDFGALRDRATRQAEMPAADRLADLYAVLGLYRESQQVGETVLERHPKDAESKYRQFWCRLMASRGDLAAALLPEPLRSLSLGERREILARLPLFGIDRARAVQRGIRPASAR